MMSEGGATLCLMGDLTESLQGLASQLAASYQVRLVALDDPDAWGSCDLILLDLSFYQGNPVLLKVRERYPNLPLLCLTATSADETYLLSQPSIDVLAKDGSSLMLHHRVAQLLSLSGLARLRRAMKNLRVTEITTGVFWLQVPEADLYLLCGCPAEVVKHMLRKGYIVTETKEEILCETGPNAILLGDLMVQNGDFANLAEFPVLQMLYRQGMIIPGHPNNTGEKPLLLGMKKQVQSQLDYIHRGNYGLLSLQELLAVGVDEATADIMLRIKRHFAFGNIRSPENFLDSVYVEKGWVEVKNGVTVRRVGINRFEFAYHNQSVIVDLNLPPVTRFQAPYTLDYHLAPREYFAVLHSGEGDGWDVNRPSMASVLMFHGRIYLVDAPPNVTHTLETLGIDISEVEGIFHTHCHDDHFAGLISLMRSDHRIKYFATPMVRASVSRKLAALLAGEVGLEHFFIIHDLLPEEWNNCDELLVRPCYSPHPVETTILLFRADDGEGPKTYAHWADLTSMEVLDAMTGDGPDKVPAAFIAQVKETYLTPANLKKLDIGGGMIHGRAEDFRDDPSTSISLAHISRKLNDVEKEIGSATPFGAVDVLIPSRRDYLRDQADRNIRSLFARLHPRKLESLIHVPIVVINPGAIIRRRGDEREEVDMVLTGVVEYVHTAQNIRYRLASGALIGEQALFDQALPQGTWRAVSHVRLLRFPLALLRTFIQDNALMEDMENIVGKVNFLRENRLFGEKLTFTILIHLARMMRSRLVRKGEKLLPVTGSAMLHLVRRGLLRHESGLTIPPGDVWGESAVLGRPQEDLHFVAEEECELLLFPANVLQTIPIIYWKLREIAERRRLAIQTLCQELTS
ncbi:MAG: cyclic nucleotide-binding domain-containing protein [Magnetococcales bacterium]|nr:cyclic nucleotide-binding domain-containing protein [Magnetococcales bacterium]